MMQPLSRFSIPGKEGCPEVFQLCVFVLINDVHILGFIPDKLSSTVQIYPTPTSVQRDQVKEWMPVISSMNTAVIVRPTLTKAQG